jgi:hypothetical protein
MRFLRLLAAWTAILSLAFPALAWNATGHRIIAAIAYERLTPKTRASVDKLIAAHPDYEKWVQDVPAEPAVRARAAFIAAAVWADNIKGDPRFWDDTLTDAQPTPLLPGFPDMKRHTNWHYYDKPYTPDGAEPQKPPVPNALEVVRLLKEIRNAPLAEAVYDLPWIEHITGDLGQPLHCVSRILKSQPKGDAGGNFVFVTPGRNLHALWDDSAGTEISYSYVSKYAVDAVAAHPAPQRIDKHPIEWIAEGYEVAKSDVYSFGLETGSREHPIPLSAPYLENAKRTAQAQIALAGYRLAAILNDRVN